MELFPLGRSVSYCVEVPIMFPRSKNRMEVSGYNLSWHTFNSHLASLSRELYQEKYFSDLTLVSDDLTAVRAHRMVLSAASPLLKKLLLINPTVQTQLFLKGIKHEVLDAVLKFIYHGEVQVPSSEISQFLQAGRDLEITELSNINRKPEELSVSENISRHWSSQPMRAQRSRISTNERQEEPPELREINTVKEVKTIIQQRENKPELQSILLKEEAVTDVA